MDLTFSIEKDMMFMHRSPRINAKNPRTEQLFVYNCRSFEFFREQ